MSSQATFVILRLHCNLKWWPAAASFHNEPACWGWLLSSHATFVILRLYCSFKSGLRPSLFIMNLLVGDGSCHLVLLLSFCACIVVSRGGLRPPLFVISLLIGDDSCHLILLLSFGAARQATKKTQCPFCVSLKQTNKHFGFR